MITRDGTKSPASFFSSYTLFEFIYRMQTDREHQLYLPLAFYIINSLLNIFLFLAVPTLGLIDIRGTFNSITLLIVFGSLFCAVIVQIILHLLKQKSLYLIQQITALCFLVEPLLLITTISLIYSSGISEALGLVICFSSSTISVLLLHWLLFETYRTYSLRCQGNYITVEMIIFQLLLVAVVFVQSTTIEMIMQVMMLMMTVKCYVQHFIDIQMDCQEYFVLKVVNTTHIAISSILVLLPLLGQHSTKPLFIFVGVIMLFFLAISLFHQDKIDQAMFRRIFQYEAGYDQILKMIDFFSGLLRKKGQNQSQELRRFIFAAAYEHNKECSETFCEFASITAQEELKDLSNKSLKQLTQKILRKFQTIFQKYHKQFADSRDVIFNYLKFYAHVLNSRHKLQKLLAQTSHLHLSWAEKYQFYHYAKICQVLENTEAIDATKVDEDIIDFQNSLVSTLTLMQEFWLEFSEEKVDLKKIIMLSTKITPSKARLDQIYQKKISQEKFAAYKILTLYALYKRYILNQVEEAIKIEDYAKILAQRLKDKQEVQYLSKETEAGFIVISLSETKLGSIYMMSDLALNLFKYNRKDIIGRNVSNVMPIVFANNHDNILIDFLKKKRRTFNTDLRLLLGRDSNGFIFPVHLQLQKASYSANDEFIFIAMVRADKLRSAPLYCLLDHEGYIRQFTASFQHTFMKNHNKNRLKSIQQLIPTYFDDNYSEDTTVTRTFTLQISNHKLGDTTATYTVVPIVVKGEHLGFLTKVTYKQLPIRQFFKNERMTQRLMVLRNEEELYSFDNQYNHRQNWFEVEKKNLGLMPVKQNTNFTLPFLSYQDFASFAKRDEKKQYGTDIKTIRYVKNHFQRKEDDQSFHSEVFSEGDKTDVQAKITEMRHRTQNKGQSTRIDTFTLIINIVLVGIIIILALSYSIYNKEPSQQAQLFQTYSFEKQVRYLLPEYIIYSTLVDKGVNSAQNQGKLDLVKTELIYSLAKSPLGQSQKESILKIIYSHSDTYIEQELQIDLQSISLQDQYTIAYLYICWGLALGLCLIVIALQGGIIWDFKDTQLGVYTVFLSLKEPAIRRIYEACRNLIRRVNIEVNKVQEDQQLLELRKENEDQNEIEKLKQFKVTSTPQDLSFWLQMIVPVSTLMTLFLTTMLVSINQFNHFISLKLVLNDFYEVVPATSIEFMKAVYEAAKSKPLPVSSNFVYYMQNIESNVVRFQDLSNSDRQDFLNVLYGDICSNNKVVSSIQSLSCEKLGNSILRNGISPTLNYLSEQFLQISIHSTEGQVRLNQLIEINYMFINPVLVKMANIMERVVNNYISQNSLTQTRIVIVGIVLTILFSVYLSLIPLKRIQQEITTTHEMIALMPPDPENTSKPLSN